MKGILLVLPFVLVMVLLLVGNHPARAAGQASVTFTINVTGGGTYQSPILNYTSNGQLFSTPVNTTATYEIDYGTTWTVSRALPNSNSSLRWELLGNPTRNAANGNANLHYYRQYLAAFGFKVVGNSTGMTPPKVNITALGKPQSVAAGYGYWVDYDSLYTYGPATGSSPGIRWFAGAGTTGNVTSRLNVYPLFYRQYLVNFALKTRGPDALQSIPLSVTALGSSSQLQLGDSGLSAWVDAGSGFSSPQVAASSLPDQRWEFHDADATQLAAPMNVTLTYYEEFRFTLSFTISGGSAPSVPVLTAISDGKQASIDLFPNGPPVWVDAGTSYSVSNLLLGSGTSERWVTVEKTTGVMNGPTSPDLYYYHQFLVGFDYVAIGGVDLPPISASFVSLGNVLSAQVSTSQSSDWIDYGSNFAVPGLFGNVSSSGRWILDSAPAVAILAPQNFTLRYYHQYQLAFTYSIAGGGGVSMVNFTGRSYGREFTTATPSGAMFWLDSGSTWVAPQFLPSQVSGERWAAKGETNGTVGVSSPAPITYVHQYLVSVVPNASAGGTVTPSRWVPSGAGFDLTAVPNGGWSFMDWNGKGTGAYTGSDANVTISVSSPLNETATFGAQITFRASGKGSLLVSTTTQNYTVSDSLTLYLAPGSRVTIHAEPGTLALFDRWSGIPDTNQDPATFAVAAPLEITGVFAPNYAVEYSLVIGAWLVLLYVVAYIVRRRGVSFSSLRRRSSKEK